jgi:alanine dehydrogenase
MNLGILKETQSGERRVAVLPEAAGALVAAGASVTMEKGAGTEAGFPDTTFVQAGVEVRPSAAAVLQTADLVIKVKGPTPAEFDAFRDGQALFCFLVADKRPELVDFLLRRRITALAFEAVRTDAGRFPLLEPMSTIAGRHAVSIGRDLRKGVAPRRVVILGGGTAGTAAAREAVGLGAAVDLFEIDAARLQHLKTRLPTGVALHPVPSPRLADFVAAADLVVNTATVPPHSRVHLVDRATVSRMGPGRVIVDVSATVGGAVETIHRLTSHDDPVFTVEGVLHYAVPNIPAIAAADASRALSRSLLPYLRALVAIGLPAALERCTELRRALVCKDGMRMAPSA